MKWFKQFFGRRKVTPPSNAIGGMTCANVLAVIEALTFSSTPTSAHLHTIAAIKPHVQGCESCMATYEAKYDSFRRKRARADIARAMGVPVEQVESQITKEKANLQERINLQEARERGEIAEESFAKRAAELDAEFNEMTTSPQLRPGATERIKCPACGATRPAHRASYKCWNCGQLA